MPKPCGPVLLALFALSLLDASCTPKAEGVNPQGTAAPTPPAPKPSAQSSAPTAQSPAPVVSSAPAVSSSAAAAPSAPATAATGGAFERRCGWVDNPTPGNWWITDRDGEWEIGVQGGHQAKGDLPDFGRAWMETNVHYGYGCACMEVRVDRPGKRVLELRHVKVLPLVRCGGDPALPKR